MVITPSFCDLVRSLGSKRVPCQMGDRILEGTLRWVLRIQIHYPRVDRRLAVVRIHGVG
jgi:hypothetical protein